MYLEKNPHKEDEMEKKICEYTIECGGYNYVTLK